MLIKKNYFVPKMNIFQYQVSICKKIIRCFRLSKEHPEYFCDPYHFFMLSKVEQDTYLDYDIETECHKMFMFNYLIVLLGYKKMIRFLSLIIQFVAKKQSEEIL